MAPRKKKRAEEEVKEEEEEEEDPRELERRKLAVIRRSITGPLKLRKLKELKELKFISRLLSEPPRGMKAVLSGGRVSYVDVPRIPIPSTSRYEPTSYLRARAAPLIPNRRGYRSSDVDAARLDAYFISDICNDTEGQRKTRLRVMLKLRTELTREDFYQLTNYQYHEGIRRYSSYLLSLMGDSKKRKIPALDSDDFKKKFCPPNGEFHRQVESIMGVRARDEKDEQLDCCICLASCDEAKEVVRCTRCFKITGHLECHEEYKKKIKTPRCVRCFTPMHFNMEPVMELKHYTRTVYALY